MGVGSEGARGVENCCCSNKLVPSTGEELRLYTGSGSPRIVVKDNEKLKPGKAVVF